MVGELVIRRVIGVAVGLVVMAGLPGCASAPKPRTIVDSFDFEGDRDVIWAACIYTLMALALPIETLDKEAGVVTSEWIDYGQTEDADYCDCGRHWPAKKLGRAGRVTLSVNSQGSRHAVKVSSEFVQATGYANTGFFDPSYYQTNCVSTGKLEREIASVMERSIERHFEAQSDSVVTSTGDVPGRIPR